MVTVLAASLVPQLPVEVPPFNGRVMRPLSSEKTIAAVEGDGPGVRVGADALRIWETLFR